MPTSILVLALCSSWVLAGPAPALPGGPTFGSSGNDGPLILAPGEQRVIDLSMDGTWLPDEWLVRFDYTLVDIGDGATLTFTNHDSRAPVAWFVLGDVSIGTGAAIRLDGQPGVAGVGRAEPGPGGFRGGRGTLAGFLDNTSAGLGPGGALGDANDLIFGGTGASHVALGLSGESASIVAHADTYGTPSLVQLAGGSGGGAGRRSSVGQTLSGGGGGGGALWIAADGTINVDGAIEARGGAGADAAIDGGAAGGGGSGGAVRLSSLSGVTLGTAAQVDTNGGAGGVGTGATAGSAPDGGSGSVGRLRLESPGSFILGPIPPATSVGTSDPTSGLNPPRVHVLSIGGQSVPPDSLLGGGLGGGSTPDLQFPDSTPLDVIVGTENLPVGSQVWLRVTHANGAATLYGPEILGVLGGSVTFFSIPATRGISAMQARATLAQP